MTSDIIATTVPMMSPIEPTTAEIFGPITVTTKFTIGARTVFQSARRNSHTLPTKFVIFSHSFFK